MPSAQVFLSYSHSDLAAANKLRELLCEVLRPAGLDVFKDDASLRSGDRWLERLQQAVAECAAFVVLVGGDGVRRWVGAEVEVALSRHLSPRDDGVSRLPIHPILLGDTAPEALPPFLALFQVERWALGQALPDGLREALLHGVQRREARPRFEGCPFLGLSTFRREDAELFFGRRFETLEALSCLGDQTESTPERLQRGAGGGARYFRWLQIAGHSGSGKSSLVHAGLLPMIERGALWPRTGYETCAVLGPIKPGRRPVERLAEALEHGLIADPVGRDTRALSVRFEHDERALAGRLHDFKANDNSKEKISFLLVVDQFEELYTLAEPAQRKAFDALLACALQDDDCPLFVVSTVRSDFLDRIDNDLPRLFALYNQRCKGYRLGSATPSGLREAIEIPARLAGLDVSEVVEPILRDAEGEPGSLPLVEHALLDLWNHRENGKLSGRRYHERGGLAGMLAIEADALLRQLDEEPGLPKGRAAALELLLFLTKADPGNRHTRWRITRGEALRVAAGPRGRVDRGERVLQRLSGERPQDRPSDANPGSLRLVVALREGDTDYVDLIHETLLRARQREDTGQIEPYWPTLYEYIDQNRDRGVLRQQLALQLEQWKKSRGVMRWFRLARWGQLPGLCKLYLDPASDDARYSRLSLGKAGVEATVLVALAASAGWQWRDGLIDFAHPVVWPAAVALWYVTDWVPVPETIALPPPSGGRFTMGCMPGRDTEPGRPCPSELPPARDVPLQAPCAIGKYEVTNLQYARYKWETGGKGFGPLFDYPAGEPWRRLDRPVVRVSWAHAQGYLEWLRDKTGDKTYRLPTEAEWEYAARGKDDAGPYPWGRGGPQRRANCADCEDRFSRRVTAPVGSYAANAFGLHDMAGNVWEWVEDRYNPDDRKPEATRVLRGGSWVSVTRLLRAAHRHHLHPDARDIFFGFRVCRGSPLETPPTEPPVSGSLKR